MMNVSAINAIVRDTTEVYRNRPVFTETLGAVEIMAYPHINDAQTEHIVDMVFVDMVFVWAPTSARKKSRCVSWRSGTDSNCGR
jgi:hypothetical protein